MTKKNLTQEDLKEILRYDPKTGDFYRLFSSGSRGPAGLIRNPPGADGHIKMSVGGQRFVASRLAFLCMVGEIPQEIGHRDGDLSNNRWDNLYGSTTADLRQGQKICHGNSSGARGVYLQKEGGKWISQIMAYGKKLYVGSFDSKAEAILAREEANKKHCHTSTH